MPEFTEIKLNDGTIIQANVLAKGISFLVVRTIDNKYLLVSRSFLTEPELFNFKE